MGGDESLMASNRTFFNDRTDLTATEVSPRGISNKTGAPSEAGNALGMNTRVIKLSQEKKSIKMLNIKGHI